MNTSATHAQTLMIARATGTQAASTQSAMELPVAAGSGGARLHIASGMGEVGGAESHQPNSPASECFFATALKIKLL
jgi:hypothetical protein